MAQIISTNQETFLLYKLKKIINNKKLAHILFRTEHEVNVKVKLGEFKFDVGSQFEVAVGLLNFMQVN